MKTLGVIDVGSNSIKLTIAEINNNSYTEIFHRKFQTRLCDFIESKSNKLSIEGMTKFFEIIYDFKKYCDGFHCKEIIAVATESLRQIQNACEIITYISITLNIEIKILSPTEECYLGYVSSIPNDLNNYIHLDMGGGSVEIGLIQDNVLVESISLPMGALNITNKFHIKNNLSEDEKLNIDNYIYDKLSNIPWLESCKNLPAIMIGGSIKTIGRIHQMENNISTNIHGYELFNEDINLLLEKFNTMSLEEIVCTTGISKSRGDILLGALIILNGIVTYLQSSKIIISKFTIREGIINTYIKNTCK